MMCKIVLFLRPDYSSAEPVFPTKINIRYVDCTSILTLYYVITLCFSVGYIISYHCRISNLIAK